MAGPISPDTKRAQAARASRAQLLLTARGVFADLGYNEATMRLIAKRAGLSTGSIFNNWTGKEALYREATGRAPPTEELVSTLVMALQGMISAYPTTIESLGFEFEANRQAHAAINLAEGKTQ